MSNDDQLGEEYQDENKSGGSAKIWLGAAAIVIVGIGAVFATGGGDTQWSDKGEPSNAVTAEIAAPVAAKAAALPAPVEDNYAIRGLVQSTAEAVIASRVTARITAMPFRPGQTFRKGALLASFDCSQTRSQLTAANAASDAYRKAYETNVELDSFQAVGKNEVEISKANLGKASAEADTIAAQLKDCAINAPFDGIVVEQIAHAYEVAASGQPLMKIQNSRDLEVQVIVPSGWLTWLRPGAAFDFKVDETGESIRSRVLRIGAAVDPVSKTLRVIGSVSNQRSAILPGMSGTAVFENANAKAGGNVGQTQIAPPPTGGAVSKPAGSQASGNGRPG